MSDTRPQCPACQMHDVNVERDGRLVCYYCKFSWSGEESADVVARRAERHNRERIRG